MNYSIEFLRLISVMLIVFTHTKHNYTEGIFYIIFEVIPRYGTAMLSVISGFLYSEYSSNQKGLLKKKIHTLLIPFIISNLVVILIVCLLKIFQLDYISRLTFDQYIIINGLFSLNSEPINPPTFFIRDIFLLFCVISLFKKNYLSLIFIIPYLIFGKIFLRFDIIFLFIIGWIISLNKGYIISKQKSINIILTIIILILFTRESYYPIKFILALNIFIFLFNYNIKFYNIGGYSYLLHLYHAPIIVIIYPIIASVISNEILLILFQFIIPIIILLLCYKLFLKLNIKFVTGGR